MIERAMTGAALAALVAALYLTEPDVSEAERQEKRYCEMTKTWQATDGEYGWPPYRKDENINCEE